MSLFIKYLLGASTGNSGGRPQWKWEHRVFLKIIYRQREGQKITFHIGQSNGITGGSCPSESRSKL